LNFVIRKIKNSYNKAQFYFNNFENGFMGKTELEAILNTIDFIKSQKNLEKNELSISQYKIK